MAEVVIYTRAGCVYCTSAKQLLDQKHVAYTEIRVDLQPEKLQEMRERSGRRTFPQIFINDKAIGGFDDMYALERSGELDKLLKD